jgi:hypothetical protein
LQLPAALLAMVCTGTGGFERVNVGVPVDVNANALIAGSAILTARYHFGLDQFGASLQVGQHTASGLLITAARRYHLHQAGTVTAASRLLKGGGSGCSRLGTIGLSSLGGFGQEVKDNHLPYVSVSVTPRPEFPASAMFIAVIGDSSRHCSALRQPKRRHCFAFFGCSIRTSNI